MFLGLHGWLIRTRKFERKKKSKTKIKRKGKQWIVLTESHWELKIKAIWENIFLFKKESNQNESENQRVEVEK